LKSRLNRAAWVGLFSALVILTAIGARELDRVLSVRTESLKAGVLRTLEDVAGRTISYDDISPSFFRRISVRNLTIHDSKDPSRPLLTIRELQVYYSLFHLLADRDPVGAIREVRLVNSNFTVDLHRDQDVVDLVERLLSAGGGAGIRARISGSEIGLTVISADSTVQLQHLFFQVDARSAAIGINARGDVGAQLRGGFSFSSSLRAEGSVQRTLDASDLTVRLQSFSSSLVNAGAQTLQVVWKGSSLEVRKIQDRSPVVLDLEADLQRSEFTLNFQSQDLRPDRLISFSRRLGTFSSLLRVPLTTSGHVTWRADTGSLEYALDASAFLEDQLPVRAVTLSTTVHGTEKMAYFSPLRLASDSGTAEFEGNLALDSLYPSGLLTLSDVRTGYGENLNGVVALDRGRDGALTVRGGEVKIGEIGFDSFLLTLVPQKSGASFTLTTSFTGSPPEESVQANGQLILGQGPRLATGGLGRPSRADSGADPGVASGAVAPGTEAAGSAASVASAGPSGPVVSVTASLRNAPPATLYHLALGAGRLSLDQQDIYNLLAHYLVSTEATISTDFSHLTLSARSVAVTSVDDPGIGFHFGLSMDKSHLSLTAFSGTYRGIAIQGGFEGDIGDGGQIGFASNLSLLGNSYLVAGRYSEAGGLNATGSYGLVVSAIPIRGGGALVKLKGEKFPLPLEGSPMPVSFDISGLVTPEGEWSADFTGLTIYDLPLPQSPHTTVTMNGRLTPRLLDVSRITVSGMGGPDLAGTARADVTLPPDLFSPQFAKALGLKGSAALHTADAGENYSVTGDLANGVLGLSTTFDGVPVGRLGITEVAGAISGSGTVGGPLDAISADLALSLKQGRLGTDPLVLDGNLVLQPGRIRVHSLSASYLAHRITGGQGTVDVARGTYSFGGVFQTQVFADVITASVGVDGSWNIAPGVASTTAAAPAPAGNATAFGAVAAAPTANAQAAAAPAARAGANAVIDLGLQGKLALSDITVAGTAAPSWSIAFRTTGQRLAFDGGPGNSMHGWVDSRLAFGANLLSPLPISGSIQGRVASGRIHAGLDVESFDLTVLNQILKSPPIDMGGGPRPVIRFTSGVGAGKLTVDGDVNDPDFTGELDIVGGGMLTGYSPDEAGPVSTSLLFEGKSFRVPRTVAPAGQARLSAEASFVIDHWVPTDWDVRLATEQKTAVRLRTRFGVLNADGAASGTLHVSGDDRRTAVDGALTVSDCRITLGKAPVGKFVPEEPPTIANVTVETGRRVEFHWPTADLPVVRTIATPGGKIAVTYRGDTGAYSIKGGTAVQGGEIYYFDRSFIMRRGSITFNEDQTTFDPWITARAEAREWDQAAGQEVKVYLDADSPLSKFSPRFSSDPARSETEILAMIGAPFVNRVDTQGIGMAAFLYSDILSQNWILRPFEQKVRQVMNLDMFSVRTQIIQNIAAQKVLGTTVNPLDNTSVSIGKYIGNDLFLEMLVRLQQPQIPVAVVQPQGGVIAESMALQTELELNLEWATPFFLMEWSFLPQHPETLFLSDNSLSFSWRFSY